jgi:hypothetical protein
VLSTLAGAAKADGEFRLISQLLLNCFGKRPIVVMRTAPTFSAAVWSEAKGLIETSNLQFNIIAMLHLFHIRQDCTTSVAVWNTALGLNEIWFGLRNPIGRLLKWEIHRGKTVLEFSLKVELEFDRINRLLLTIMSCQQCKVMEMVQTILVSALSMDGVFSKTSKQRNSDKMVQICSGVR